MSASLPDVPAPFEVQAFSALRRATDHGRALGAAMDEAHLALGKGGLDELERQLTKLLEWQRFLCVRLELLTKRVVGGAP